jgi:hypothetical protein
VHLKKEVKASAIQSRSKVPHGDWFCIRSSWLKDSDSVLILSYLKATFKFARKINEIILMEQNEAKFTILKARIIDLLFQFIKRASSQKLKWNHIRCRLDLDNV